MKKSLTAAVLAAMLLIGNVAFAKDGLKAPPWITPGSNPFFYNLKILFEDVKETILHFVSPKGEIAWIERRIQERDAEMQELKDEYLAQVQDQGKGGGKVAVAWDQNAFLEAMGLKADEMRALGRDAENARAADFAALHQFLTTEGQVADPQQEVLKNMATRLAALRAGLLAAHAAGDDAQVGALAAELKTAQNDYLQALDVQDQVARTNNLAENSLLDRILGQLGLNPSQSADEIAARAERDKQRIKDEEDALGVEPALRTNFDDFDKRVAKAVADAKAAGNDGKANRLPFDQLAKLLLGADADSRRRIKEDAIEKQLPEEGARPPAPAQPTPPAMPATPPKQAAPQPKPILQKIPSDTVSRSPLILEIPFGGLDGKVGQSFSASFGGRGGLPPYHYQLATAGGFPPFGIVLDLNGKLSGTPTAAGSRTFDVCVVDTAGKSDCQTVTMTVEAVEINPSVTVMTEACGQDSFGRYQATYTGTASGPVGAYVSAPSGHTPSSCSAWHGSKDWSGLINPCGRGENDPEQTSWTYSVSVDSTMDFAFSSPIDVNLHNPCCALGLDFPSCR